MAFDISTAQPVKQGFDISSAKPIQPKKVMPRKDIIDFYTGGKEQIPVENRVARAAYQTGKDISAIPLHFLNQMAMNLPRAGAEKAGLDFSKPESGVATALAGTAGAVGGLKNPLIKSIAAAPTLAKTVLRSAIAGGAYTPTEDIAGLPQRAIQAVIGAAIPFGGSLIKATGKVTAKSGRWVAKNVGGITDSSMNVIKEHIKKYGNVDKIFDPLKAKADYVTQDLVPRVQKEFSDSVAQFTPSIQKFAQEKLKVPLSAINTIKKNGIEKINQIRQVYQDSTDPIFQGIQQGFKAQSDSAKQAFVDAWAGIPKNAPINATQTYGTLKNVLTDNGLLKDGLVTPLAQNSAVKDSAIGKALNLYELFNNNPILTKEQFQLIKSTMDDLPFDKPSYVKIIRPLRDSIYQDAENTGAKGIKQARILYKKMSDMEDKYSSASLMKEKSLNNFQKMSKDQIRQLKEIEDYTHFEFVNDLDTLTAGKYLDNFSKFDTEKIANDLLKAKNPEWTKVIEKEYSDLLGVEKFKRIKEDLMAHFVNQDFNLTSETPGAGGGIYTGLSGLQKAAVGGATRQYYKNVAPKIEVGKKVVESGVQRIKQFMR